MAPPPRRAIPAATRYVPELVHPKRVVEGVQTAIVTGPEGEEIYPDKCGRVKVRFHWDREGQYNEKTTCWLRVSQGWAGSNYGTMAVPRITARTTGQRTEKNLHQ